MTELAIMNTSMYNRLRSAGLVVQADPRQLGTLAGIEIKVESKQRMGTDYKMIIKDIEEIACKN